MFFDRKHSKTIIMVYLCITIWWIKYASIENIFKCQLTASGSYPWPWFIKFVFLYFLIDSFANFLRSRFIWLRQNMMSSKIVEGIALYYMSFMYISVKFWCVYVCMCVCVCVCVCACVSVCVSVCVCVC